MFEGLKNIALYGATDRESYRAISGKVEANNRMATLVISSVGATLMAVMLLLSFYQKGFASSRPVYLVGALFCLVNALISLASRKYPVLTYVAVYAAVTVALVYGIAIATLTRPEEQTVTFMVLLILVPLVFVDRPVRMAGVLAAFIVAFIVMACQFKATHILAADVTDAIVFGVLAIIAEAMVNCAKIRGYVLEERLHVMSLTDQLTGLNNRNCYELELGRYPGRFEKSISCIYLDANGLHELNNEKGHAEGDKMLRFIAGVVREVFGSEDTYRIGGDEFVAFALDRPKEETERKLSELRATIDGAGYNVSAGYCYTAVGGAGFEEVVGNAEASMYRSKAEYYKAHDRRR